MAYTTIQTPDGEMTFRAPDSGGYVKWVRSYTNEDANKQLCDHGGFRGYTITANADTLNEVARKWCRDRYGEDMPE